MCYGDLLSLEPTLDPTNLAMLKGFDNGFKVGWLHDEVVNLFFHQLYKAHDSIIYCPSTEALVIAQDKTYRRLWRGEDITNKELLLIPFNPSSNHWILIAIELIKRIMYIFDPMTNNNNPISYPDATKVGSRLVQQKFNRQLTYITTQRHATQQDYTSCGVFVCYYAEQLFKGNNIRFPDTKLSFLLCLKYTSTSKQGGLFSLSMVFFSSISGLPMDKSFDVSNYNVTVGNCLKGLKDDFKSKRNLYKVIDIKFQTKY